MATTSKRLLALQDLVARLEKIQVAEGYHTDAGLHIFLGEAPKQGKDDPDASLAIFVLTDEALEGAYTQGGLCRYRIPIEIVGLLKLASGSQPLEEYEGLIADIKEAVEIEGRDPGTNAARDRYLGVIPDSDPPQPVTLPKGLERGATRINFREGGSEIASVVVEYFAAIEEKWGQP